MKSGKLLTLTAGTTTSLSPVLTLSIYTGIALHTGRNPLTASQTFTALSIVSLISSPLSNLVYSGPKVTGAVECFQRIQAYLLANSRYDDRIIDQSRISHDIRECGAEQECADAIAFRPIKTRGTVSGKSPLRNRKEIIQLDQADFGWDRKSAAALSNITFQCSESSFTIIVGAVGSGKSMLLKAILGEVPCLKGSIRMEVSEIAYCDSVPWIRHGTIRDNICKPLPYEEDWYRTALHVTSLDEDIENLPQNDLTIIGSNGTAISGGQRQRISIARAVYARKQVAVFDDVLSGLDAKTSDQVFTRVFGQDGILRRLGVTTILVNHAINFLPSADQVVVLHDGKILKQGPPSRTEPANLGFLDASVSSKSSTEERRVDRQHGAIKSIPRSPISDNEMERKLGDLGVYAYYLRAAGYRNMALYFACLVVGILCSQFPSEFILEDIRFNQANMCRPLGSMVGG